MDQFFIGLAVTVVGGIIVLVIEYKFGFFAKLQEKNADAKSNRNDWSFASGRAAARFQEMQRSINWKDYSVQVIRTEAPVKGKQRIRIQIAKNYLSHDLPDRGLYDLTIDRAGDILEIAQVHSQNQTTNDYANAVRSNNRPSDRLPISSDTSRRRLNQKRLNETIFRLVCILMAFFVYYAFTSVLLSRCWNLNQMTLGTARCPGLSDGTLISIESAKWIYTILSLLVYVGLHKLAQLVNDKYILHIIDNYKNITPKRRAVYHFAIVLFLMPIWISFLAFFLHQSVSWLIILTEIGGSLFLGGSVVVADVTRKGDW